MENFENVIGMPLNSEQKNTLERFSNDGGFVLELTGDGSIKCKNLSLLDKIKNAPLDFIIWLLYRRNFRGF